MLKTAFSLFCASAVASSYVLQKGEKAEMPEECTALAVGRDATVDGSTFSTHTADCKNCDFRIRHAPRRKVTLPAKRPIYRSELSYPRYVGSFYPGFEAVGDQVDTVPVGYIDETMEETYSFHNGLYGIMNEHMLSIGESTCAGMIWTDVAPKGKAMFEVGALSRVAMERCKTARCAVELMGKLAYEHGFFGAEAVSGEAGEALTVTDGVESWVFHIMGDLSGTSAIWAAQRVAPDHIAVVANAFVIREVDMDDKENFLFSPNLVSEAVKAGLHKEGDDVFDFALTYSPSLQQITNPINYSTRRQWRVFSIAAPEFTAANLNPNDKHFPFSVKVEKKLSAQGVMNINRDYFQGTEFDLSEGLGAGPFGTPVRYENLPTVAWERPISLHRTVYSTVLQSRTKAGEVGVDGSSEPSVAAGTDLPKEVGGVAWLSFDTPHSSAYSPFFAGSQATPDSYGIGSLSTFDRKSAFWCFQFIGNWVNLMFKPMIKDVQYAQGIAEAEAFKMVERVTADAVKTVADGNEDSLAKTLTDECLSYANALLEAWWALGEHLIGKYNDGYINEPTVGGAIGYPEWWVRAIGGQMMTEQKAKELQDAKSNPTSDKLDEKDASTTPTDGDAAQAPGQSSEETEAAVQMHGGTAAMVAITLLVVGVGAGFALGGRGRGYMPVGGVMDEDEEARMLNKQTYQQDANLGYQARS